MIRKEPQSVELLVSTLNQNPKELIEEMKVSSNAVFVNQCDTNQVEEWEHRGKKIRVYHMAERGIGKSRNFAMMQADSDICLFSDEDIVYVDGYETSILKEFSVNPRADMILFNLEIEKERQTYFNTDRKRVHLLNCGRYGAVSFAIRTEVLREKNVFFSLLFGGGAKYSNGEDSLFLKELIQKGCKVYTSPVVIGKEISSPSTWFTGYNRKFFIDRGVLYRFLYGKMARLLALRFLLAHKEKMCSEYSVKEAYRLMKQGIKRDAEE